jgi:hypothetical protein
MSIMRITGVNDRPYVASSFLSVAIAEVFGTALNGRSRERPELVKTPIPLEAQLAAVPVRGGIEVLRRLFEPLGYRVTAHSHALDPRFPEWGARITLTVTLQGVVRLSDLLAHLYVLIPVLDAHKHYYFGTDEAVRLQLTIAPVDPEDAEVGAPSQLVAFTLIGRT